MARQLLWKFRKLDKHAIDILVHRRLYLSDWAELNDPHEGRLWINTHGKTSIAGPREIIRLIDNRENVDVLNLRICALSKTWDSNLLWSHYADGHRGIAIGLELPDDLENQEIVEVKYDDQIPLVEAPIDSSMLRTALVHKSREWRHEEEVRLLSFDSSERYVEGIMLREVIFGLRSDTQDIVLVRKLFPSKEVVLSHIINEMPFYLLDKKEVPLKPQS